MCQEIGRAEYQWELFHYYPAFEDWIDGLEW